MPDSADLLEPLLRSFQFSLAATLLAGIVGLFAAARLRHARFPGRHFVDALLNVPLVLPPTVLGYYLLVLLGRSSALGRAFEGLTGTSIVFTPTGAIVAAAFAALPFVTRSARAALEDVDPRFAEAAASLGASPRRTLLRVLVPLASRGILAGLTLGFARSLGDFGVTLMVAGNIPGSTQTASLAIYDAVQGGHDLAAAGLSLVLTGLAVAALYAVNKLAEARRAN